VETILTGLTWDHPRGYAPLVNGASEYEKLNPGLKIRWDRRSLREFGEAPIDQYVDRYDLLIVDHPFVGYAAAHDALVNLDPFLTEAEKLLWAVDSVGPSWESYWYQGCLWALPIDAATQVASYRPDLLQRFCPVVPRTLDDVLALARKARACSKFIVVPACPTDAISLFFTLSANLGHPIAEASEIFVDDVVGREVLDRLHALISAAHPNSVEWNPIQVYDFMVSTSDAIYCPYGFGYSNYSRIERPVLLKFADAPAAGARGCAGTMLGGTGVAVSIKSMQQEKTIAYAKWLISQEHQRGTYFRNGGQPASLAAWMDPAVDAAASGFFSGTLHTLQTSYLRPRFDGFVRFFESAGIEINKCLKAQIADSDLIAWLNARYARQRNAVRQIA
jgi:multiple sugar transport system substrate-binding protein